MTIVLRSSVTKQFPIRAIGSCLPERKVPPSCGSGARLGRLMQLPCGRIPIFRAKPIQSAAIGSANAAVIGELLTGNGGTRGAKESPARAGLSSSFDRAGSSPACHRRICTTSRAVSLARSGPGLASAVAHAPQFRAVHATKCPHPARIESGRHCWSLRRGGKQIACRLIRICPIFTMDIMNAISCRRGRFPHRTWTPL
jgi:hypothetical protein